MGFVRLMRGHKQERHIFPTFFEIPESPEDLNRKLREETSGRGQGEGNPRPQEIEVGCFRRFGGLGVGSKHLDT